MNAAFDPPESSDCFRLHYVQDTQRCVITYESLPAALENARARLQSKPQLELWITDATRRVLLTSAEIRARLAEAGPRDSDLAA